MSRLRLVLAAATLLVPLAGRANGYDLPNTEARSLGMAGSTVAVQDSAGAAYANPAALSSLRGLNLSLGVSMLDLRTSWTAPANPPPGSIPAGSRLSDHTGFHPVPPPALFAAYGGSVRGHGWGAGIGWNALGGGNVFWPSDWAGRFRIVQVNRRVYGFYATGGFEVVKQLRIGAGIVYYRTTEHLIIGLDFPQPGANTEGQGEIGTSGGAVSFDLSALVTPLPDYPFWIGIDYKHQGVQNLSGHAHVSGAPVQFQGQLSDQTATHTLTVPNALNVGLGWKPAPRLLLTFGYTLNRYQVYRQDVFSGSRGFALVVPRDYSNGHVFRLGAEYELTEKIKVRAGFLRDVSGLTTDTLSPTLPDANAWAGSAGLSYYLTPAIGLHGAIFYANLDSVTATNLPLAFPGTYDTRAIIYSLSVTWRGPELIH